MDGVETIGQQAVAPREGTGFICGSVLVGFWVLGSIGCPAHKLADEPTTHHRVSCQAAVQIWQLQSVCLQWAAPANSEARGSYHGFPLQKTHTHPTCISSVGKRMCMAPLTYPR